MSADGFELEVNGQRLRCGGRLTVADLLRFLDQDPRTVAVELAGDIVPRDDYAETVLADGAKLEIVRFVQGG